jgi:hypothetical protein
VRKTPLKRSTTQKLKPSAGRIPLYGATPPHIDAR